LDVWGPDAIGDGRTMRPRSRDICNNGVAAATAAAEATTTVAGTVAAEAEGAVLNAKDEESELIGMDGNIEDSGGCWGRQWCFLWILFMCRKKNTPFMKGNMNSHVRCYKR
jgi:hypothetical protein